MLFFKGGFEMIINILLALIIISFSIFFCYKEYKKSDTYLEKALFVLFLVSIIFPISIYYLDRYNIPTLLEWNKNINTQNWLSFISTYSVGIICSFISVIFLILVTFIQINLNDKEIFKKDKMNVLPTLQYSFIRKKNNNKTKKDICVVMNIKNIGLGAVKGCYISVNNKLNSYIHYPCIIALI